VGKRLPRIGERGYAGAGSMSPPDADERASGIRLC
jgi:hypothetical protein